MKTMTVERTETAYVGSLALAAGGAGSNLVWMDVDNITIKDMRRRGIIITCRGFFPFAHRKSANITKS